MILFKYNREQCSNTSSSETDEIEIQEVQNYDDDDYTCEDLEEVIEDDTEQDPEVETTTTYYVQQEAFSDVNQDETIDKKLLADFLLQHAIQKGPSKFLCNLCQQEEFNSMKFLESHMKTIHSNWIKANCKKQPTCEICFKSFRGKQSYLLS